MRITLCGSTRFAEEFKNWNSLLTLAGHSVYSVAMTMRQAGDVGKDHLEVVSDEQKTVLDLVHLDKISNSDAILVLNVDGYIGESTRREILWAAMHGKSIFAIETGNDRTISILETMDRVAVIEPTVMDVQDLVYRR